jgi:hypothetical protein
VSGGSISGAARPRDYRVAVLPDILKIIEPSIRIKVFFRRYVHSLKEYELSNFKLKCLGRTLSAIRRMKNQAGCALPRS